MENKIVSTTVPDPNDLGNGLYLGYRNFADLWHEPIVEDAEFEVIEPKIICGMKVTDERWQKTEDIECEVIPPKAIDEGKAEDEPSVARMPK